MKINRLEVEQYKSIKGPIELSFSDGMPIVLIGKNGCGKTNILEVLNNICNANCRSSRLRPLSAMWGHTDFFVYIQPTEDDLAPFSEFVSVDKNGEIVAGRHGEKLAINWMSSPSIVPQLKKELKKISKQVGKLHAYVLEYKEEIDKVLFDEEDLSPFAPDRALAALTEVSDIVGVMRNIKSFLGDMLSATESFLAQFSETDENVLEFANRELYSLRDSLNEKAPPPLVLTYKKRPTSYFEEKFVSIDEDGIKKEIEKVNQKTEELRHRIDDLSENILQKAKSVSEFLDDFEEEERERFEKEKTFVSKVKGAFGQKCIFLKNESSNVIFKSRDQEGNVYFENGASRYILQTYLHHIYKGRDRDKLIEVFSGSYSNRPISLSEEDCNRFEKYLNDSIPSFDRDRYRIRFDISEAKNPLITLVEQTGDEVLLEETSAGRRWYFTYYFMKNTLRKGDFFLIDEPGVMLHPVAQKELRDDLKALAKKGIRVVYSTHSPYLIPENGHGVHFVTMTDDGTKVTPTSELKDVLCEVVGEDIFDVQRIYDAYLSGNQEEIGKRCYDAVKKKDPKLEKAAEALILTEAAIISWQRKGDHFRCPKFENILRVARYTETDIKDLLGLS